MSSHTNHVQEKSTGVSRSLTIAEGSKRVKGTRELERRGHQTRQPDLAGRPDSSQNTVQGPPPGSCIVDQSMVVWVFHGLRGDATNHSIGLFDGDYSVDGLWDQ